MSGILDRLRPTPWGELSSARKARRVIGAVAQVGALGMVVSAVSSGNEVGLRADGSLAREHRDEINEVAGDPKVKAQRDQAGEQKAGSQPDAEPQPGSGSGSGDVEAQGGNDADDTEQAAESST